MAMRRLLLENVFLLAGKRIPVATKDILEDSECINLLKVTFLKPMQSIFNYYSNKADIRRSIAMSNLLTRRGKQLQENNREEITNITAPPAPLTDELKLQMKEMRFLWGFEEYLEFCHDFNLKSTTLLTGIQTGDVYLSVVPLDLELKTTKGMNFNQFCQILICMSIVAYRDISYVTTPVNKVIYIYKYKVDFILYIYVYVIVKSIIIMYLEVTQ